MKLRFRFLAILAWALAAGAGYAAEDGFEDNDTRPTATAVTTGTLYQNLYCGDDDWYSIVVPHGAKIDAAIYFHETDDLTDLDMKLYDSAGVEIGSSPSSWDDERIASAALNAGTYYVKVYAGNVGATNTYDLRIFVNAADISLPEVLAVELPNAADTAISASAGDMAALLGSATSGALQVTHDRTGFTFPLGGTLVTWTAWAGAPGSSAVTAMTSRMIWVLRKGQTPLGKTLKKQATGGNHSAHMIRDTTGKIHIAWVDQIADKVMSVRYRSGVQNQTTGAIVWSSIAAVNTDDSVSGNDKTVALAVSANYLHFCWYHKSDDWQYRRMELSSGTFDPVRNIPAGGDMGNRGDNSASLWARSDTEVHMVSQHMNNVTPMKYTRSLDGGGTWTLLEVVPRPGDNLRDVSAALDSQGNVHVCYTHIERDSAGNPNAPGDGFWPMYYVRRTAATSTWSTPEKVLDTFPEWRDSRIGHVSTDPEWHFDVLTAFSNIKIDANDNLHLTFHGSCNTHIYGNDETFYLQRPSMGAGSWGAWTQPINLYPNVSTGKFSFAPAMCLDEYSRRILPVLFFGLTADHTPSDVAFRELNNALGASPSAALINTAVILTDTSQYDQNSWFPSAGLAPYRDTRGRAWLDVLYAANGVFKVGGGKSPWPVVYQKYELTPAFVSTPTPADGATGIARNVQPSCSTAAGAVQYRVYFGTSQAGVNAAAPGSPEDRGLQAGANFTPPGSPLAYSQTYYWRIDAANPYGEVHGPTWSFTTASNQNPVVANNNTLTVNEGATGAITTALLSVTDAEDPANLITFTIGTAPARGTLKRNNVTVGAGGTFTQADINANLISYTHDGSETTTDSFTFTAADSASGSTGSRTFTIAITPVNDAPTVASALTATPNPAQAGQTVAFSVTGQDAEAGPLTYSWNYGDGGTGAGSGSHSYAAAGAYLVIVTVTDTDGLTATDQITVNVTATTPGPGGGGTPGVKIAMSLTKMSGAVKFGSGGKDSCQVSGVIPNVPAGFDPKGAVMTFDVGGAQVSFMLDGKGRAKSGGSSLQLKLKPATKDKATKRLIFGGGSVPFKAMLKGGTWSDDWDDEGVKSDATKTKVSMPIVVDLKFNGNVYTATANTIYSSKAGVGGKFKK